MEKSLQLIDFTSTTDNRIAQVHDYNNVSMFKIDPGMKKATKEIITIFGANYPELLSTKFFHQRALDYGLGIHIFQNY